MPGNTHAVGPMHEVVHESLSHLTDADLHAMAVYLKHQKPAEAPLAPSPDKWPRQVAAGALYRDHCGLSPERWPRHCRDGPRAQGERRGHRGRTVQRHHGDARGIPSPGAVGCHGCFCRYAERRADRRCGEYVRTAWGNEAQPNATPWGVTSLRKYAGSPADASAADSRAISHALLCPDMDAALIKPALAAAPDSLEKAAADRGKCRACTAVRNGCPEGHERRSG